MTVLQVVIEKLTGKPLEALRTQPVEFAVRHMANSRAVFLRLLETYRSFPQNHFEEALAITSFSSSASSSISWADDERGGKCLTMSLVGIGFGPIQCRLFLLEAHSANWLICL